MIVRLKGQDTPIKLSEVEVNDDHAVVGTTGSGKRFVALRNRVRGKQPPIRHPYRVYLRGGRGLKAVGPSFEETEKWLLDGLAESQLFTMADGEELEVRVEDVQSILSASPQDEAATQGSAN